MTPFSTPFTPAEEKYNDSHRTTQAVIQQTITALKTRFQCLDQANGCLQYSPAKVGQIFVACCVLHNIAATRGIPLLHEGTQNNGSDDDDEEEGEEDSFRTHFRIQASQSSSEAEAVRARLIQTFF
nr:PREDICTED: putative nuclease HARBI1 [Latimeria chalumnae]|eukprot:XP_014339955.1 PREDICTED: putative nuclease HARBI1 [Latimeria chalumnae]